jgi:hypothetical protein
MRKPSPVVFTSRPRWRRSDPRTREWWTASSSHQARSPIDQASPVESTMSVNRMVASIAGTPSRAGLKPDRGSR